MNTDRLTPEGKRMLELARLTRAKHLNTDKSPPFPATTIGRLPAVIVNVKFPRDFRLADFAALVARTGRRLKWIRRGKRAKER